MMFKSVVGILCIFIIILSISATFIIVDKADFTPTSMASAGTLSLNVVGNVTLTANLTNNDGIKLNATFSCINGARTINDNITAGNLNTTVYTGTYNLTIATIDNKTNITLYNTPITQNTNNILSLDNISTSTPSLFLNSGYEWVNAYAIETSLDYDSINLVLKYDNPSRVSESSLRPYKCANYNFNSRTCSGSWSVISTYTQNIDLNTFTFVLTSLSGFAIGTQIPSVVSETSASGGGGGSRLFIASPLKTDKEVVKVKIKQGETETEKIKITNKGTTGTVNVEITGVKDFVSIDEKRFIMQTGESRTIPLTFTIPKDLEPDVYTGKIIFKTSYNSLEIPVVIEVVSKGPLFDVLIEIPEQFKIIMPGEDIMAKITVYNIEKLGMIDVSIEYAIKDDEGNVITSSEESLAIERQVSTVKTFKLPENAKSGNYVLYAKASYGEVMGIGSDTFKVTLLPEWFIVFKEMIFAVVIFIILLIFVIIIFYQYRMINEAMRKHGRMNGKELIRIRRIERKQKLGKKAFRMSIISDIKDLLKRILEKKKEKKKRKAKVKIHPVIYYDKSGREYTLKKNGKTKKAYESSDEQS